MSSQINISSINSNFPVPGVDNPSQGFRDNFANIKIALTTASNEISDLQLNTARLDGTNNFDFKGVISKAKIQNSGMVAINNAAINGAISFASGSYHKSSITTNTTFLVSSWPLPDVGNVFGQIRLEIAPNTSTSISINFSAGEGKLVKEASLSLPYTSNSTNSTIWDLWSTDGGVTVFLKFVGGPFS